MSNPRWPIEQYGQDLNKAIPNAIQIVGGVQILQKSFWHQPFSTTTDSAEVILTTAGPYAVQTTDSIIITRLAAPGIVTLLLPSAGQRSGLILGIADWAGNATINLVPDGAERIMGLANGQLISAGQGLGTGVSVYLRPVTSLAGWVNI